ncbi:MAG: hypothetical protein Sw2PiMacB_18690 [Shewanella algae]
MKHSQRLFPLLTLMLSLILPGCLLPGDANAAEQGVAINYIHGEGQANGIKLAYQLYLDTLKPISEDLELTLEASINFLEYGEDNQHDVNHVLAMSPILRYPLMRGQWLDFYLEAGIGFALLDDSQFAGKDVGSHYQFEDRLGFAFKFGRQRKQTVSITYLHYSNAGLSKPNPGLDFVNLAYSYRF